MQTPSVVIFSPLPPKPNGIADYCLELLGLLSGKVACTVVVEDGTAVAEAPDGVTVLQETEYRSQAAAYADVLHVYQVGNNPDHVYMLPFIAERPGLLVLHEPVLHHLLDCVTAARGDLEAYAWALEAEYGASGRVLAEQFQQHQFREPRMYFDLPMISGLAGPARGVIVHSRYAAMKVLSRAPAATVHVVPHQFSPPPPGQIEPPQAVRARLGLEPGEVLLLSLGFVTRTKRIDNALRALASVQDRMPPFRYVIGGEFRPDEIDVPALASTLGLQDRVTLLGYVAQTEFFSLMRAADIVVNLRHPVGGETSGTMIRALGSGSCVVTVDRGAFGEVPDDAIVKLRWGPGFDGRLAKELLSLAWEPERRARIGRAASALTRTYNAPERTAAGYLAAIRQAASTPPPLWNSSAQWELAPPHELERLGRVARAAPSAAPLPLWFRAGAVPGSATPCRVLRLGGGAAENRLLALLGHKESAVEAISGNGLADIAPRTLDLAVMFVTVRDLPEDTAPLLRRINRALGFGGILVVEVLRDTGNAAPHPLESQSDGTRLLQACGFRVDLGTAIPPATIEPGSAALPDSRVWRAVKVSEFVSKITAKPLSAQMEPAA